MDIMEDMMSSEFKAAILRATRVRSIRVGRTMNNDRGVIHFIARLSSVAPAAKNLCIMQFGSPRLKISSQKNILLMIQAADSFVRNDDSTAPFHANTFDRHVRAVLGKLHV